MENERFYKTINKYEIDSLLDFLTFIFFKETNSILSKVFFTHTRKVLFWI